MNPIDRLFAEKGKDVLSIYFTAGFPKLNDTTVILRELQHAGADLVEIGIPFSDPLADGPIIQRSGETALKNGMSLKLLFRQLQTVDCRLPMVLMGYLNPVLQFGVEEFCRQASACGIAGVILPDLPIEEYVSQHKRTLDRYGLKNIFLITPQTTGKRIRMIDSHSSGFIYAVSSSSTTGTRMGMDGEKEKFFERIKQMKLKNPVMIGFGISDKESFNKACAHANGAIIGSAFIKAIRDTDLTTSVRNYISTIK